MKTTFLTIVTIIFILSGTNIDAQPLVWPSAGWEKSTPAEQGMDSKPLIELESRLKAGDSGFADGMLVTRNGYVVMETHYQRDYAAINSEAKQVASLQSSDRPEYNYYDTNYHPYYQGTGLHTIQSITKAITSLAFGIAIGRGEIPDVNVKMVDYFSDRKIEHLDERKASMTIEDLLTMRAGFDWNEGEVPYYDSRNHAIQLEKSDDWIGFVLNRPMRYQPGSVREYSSGASQLLSGIIKESTGMYIDEYYEKHLFPPLGITEYHWKKTPRHVPDTLGGLYLHPGDLAKIGYLMLNDGVWDEERILPEGWVKATVTPQAESQKDAQGYQWRLIPYLHNNIKSYIYTHGGFGGQVIYVIPEFRLVAVFTSWNIFESRGLSNETLLSYLFAALNAKVELHPVSAE